MMPSKKYKTYRWKWDNYPKLKKVDKMPLNIDLELTTQCNYKCPFCPHTYDPPEITDMPIDMALKIIDEFAEKKGYAIKFCYLGEPLLYKHLTFLIKHAKEKGIIDTIVSTNGSLLNEEKSKELIESGLDFLIISIDSCKKEIYKKVRVGGNLDTIKKNIATLHDLKQSYNTKKPIVQIQVINMDLNRDEIVSGEYEKFWSPYADIIRISPYCNDYTNKINVGELPNFICSSVFQRMTIRVNGDIALCCGARLDSKILGNININSLEEIWNSKKFTEIRKLMSEGKSHLIEACKTCPRRLNQGVKNETIKNNE